MEGTYDDLNREDTRPQNLMADKLEIKMAVL